MTARAAACWAGAVLLLAGCHRAPVRATAPPPPPPPVIGPVMVSVPPPTHRSDASPDEIATSDIPVVKPVRPPRKPSRRQASGTVAVAAAAPSPAGVAPPPATAPPPVNVAQSLGQLTAGSDDAAATRDQVAQAMRVQRERLLATPQAVQASHANEIEQARRFLKAAGTAWNGADYNAALTLTTKARVLLDDLSK